MTDLDNTVTDVIEISPAKQRRIAREEKRAVWERMVRDHQEHSTSIGLQPVYCYLTVEDGKKAYRPVNDTTGHPDRVPFGTWVEPPGPKYDRIAYRPPLHAIFLDVDQHEGGRDGVTSLLTAEIDLGLLPDTQRLTARGPGQKSGRLAFRIPEWLHVDERFFEQYGGAIDVIRTGHRLCMAVGDLHPNGQRVVCYGPDGTPEDLRHVDEWPHLPVDWLLALAEWNDEHPAARGAGVPAEMDDEDFLNTVMARPQAEAMAARALDRIREHDVSSASSGVRQVILRSAKTVGGLVGSLYADQDEAATALMGAAGELWPEEGLDSDVLRMIADGLATGQERPWTVTDLVPAADDVAPVFSIIRGGAAEEDGPVSGAAEGTKRVLTLPSPGTPARVAREVSDVLDRRGKPLLISHDDWYQYDSRRYKMLSPNQVKALLYRVTEHAVYPSKDGDKPWNPNSKTVGSLRDALGGLTDRFAEVGSWTGDKKDRPEITGTLIPCRNGILNTDGLEVLPHDRRWFFTHCLPLDYDPEAQCPVWLDALNTQWSGQLDTIAALQEWFGYVLSGRTDLHKAALLYGPRRSFKGTASRILQTLLGEANKQAMSLSGLASEFGLSGATSAPLLVFGDVRWTGIPGVSQVVSKILEITGEDNVTINRKYKEPWTGKLPGRLMFMSNDEPSLPDASGALASRFLVFGTTTSFLGKEDPTLEPRILAELAGVLNWALEGLRRLEANGRFTKPDGADERLAEMESAGSPVAGFVRECCELDDSAETEVSELYAAYQEWCNVNHLDWTDVPRFGQRFRSVVPQPSKPVRHYVDGVRTRFMAGVRLREARGASDFAGPAD